MNNVVSVCLT